MNFKNFESKFKPSSKDMIRASWSQVRFCPDLVSNEQIAIGVFANLDDILYVKFIEDFSKLECAYGIEITEYTKNCIEIFEDYIHQNHELSFSKQLIIEKRGFVQGESIHKILNELLIKAVPLSIPHNTTKINKVFKTVKTVTFKSDVKTYVKSKMGQIYKEVFCEESTLIGDRDVGFRRLPISLQVDKDHKIGDLVSSVYATSDKMEVNCLKSLDNLGRAKKFLKAKNDVKLFMLSPDKENLDLMTKNEKSKRETILNDFRWRLACEGISLIESDSHERISEEIIEWSHLDRNFSLI